MDIVVVQHSSVPAYEQIKEQIKDAILSGILVEEEKLPSIRSLARDLKVSVITTTRAYNDLELEGYIVSVPGKGCYVKKVDVSFIQAKYLEEAKEALKIAVEKGKMAGLAIADIHGLLDELEEK